MYIVSNLVKVTIPNYLAGLPIPDTIGGWFRLGVRDWLALIPPTVVIGGISYYSYETIKKARRAGSGQVNPGIRKDLKKVVDFIDIEDITEKASLCRCWKSKNPQLPEEDPRTGSKRSARSRSKYNGRIATVPMVHTTGKPETIPAQSLSDISQLKKPSENQSLFITGDRGVGKKWSR